MSRAQAAPGGPPEAAQTAAPAEPRGGASERVPQGVTARPREIGGREGPEPTRYGDWEREGRCIDF